MDLTTRQFIEQSTYQYACDLANLFHKNAEPVLLLNIHDIVEQSSATAIAEQFMHDHNYDFIN